MNIKHYSKDDLNNILSVKGNSLYSDAFKRLLKKQSLINKFNYFIIDHPPLFFWTYISSI